MIETAGGILAHTLELRAHYRARPPILDDPLKVIGLPFNKLQLVFAEGCEPE
jgi:hypothetical protein